MNQHEVWHEMFVLTPGNVDSCMKAAKAGDSRAQQCMSGFSRCVEMLQTESASCLCDDCVSEFDQANMPAAFVILLPAFADPESEYAIAIVSGLCLACVRRGKIMDLAVEQIQKKLGADYAIRSMMVH
jgi:hypothetical protein